MGHSWLHVSFTTDSRSDTNPPLSVHTTDESGLTATTSTKSATNVISGTSTSTETTDNEQRLTVSQPSPLGINTGYAVDGAVGGLLIVFVAVAVIITLLVVKRGQAHKI